MDVFQLPSELQMGERSESADFSGAQDLTDEVIIHDRCPIFMASYSIIYKGTCYGYPVSLIVLTRGNLSLIFEVVIKVLKVMTNKLRTVQQVGVSQ